MVTTMRHVDDFERIILLHFSSVMDQYQMRLVSNSNEIFDEVALIGKMYSIIFAYDRGETSCVYTSLQTGRKYPLYEVYKLLCAGDAEIALSINDTPEESVIKYRSMLEQKLPHLLAGDLTWVGAYDSIY